MFKTGKTINKIFLGTIAVVCLVFVGAFCAIKNNFTLAQTNSADAIAIRIIANPNHSSALGWYRQQGFKGSPQSTTVDGYEAVRDGRTVYANVANAVSGASTNNLYTNIYLISYNQEAGSETIDIFGDILSHWKFNSNVDKIGHCRLNKDIACTLDDECAMGDVCDSQKARIIRDVRRLADINNIDDLMSGYYKIKRYYPKLSAGTYLSRHTISVWPSWKDELGEALGSSLPVDPINKIGDCSGFNADTCWNDETKRFVTALPDLPNNSLLYSYAALPNGTNYDLCAVFESGLSFPLAASTRSICALPVCLDFDRDGYGRPASSRCTHPEQDCNDTDPSIGGGGSEVCDNGIDDDCDGFVDCYDSDCSGAVNCAGALTCDFEGGSAPWPNCDSGEDCNSCPSDCGACPVTRGDGFCDPSCNECNDYYGAGLDCYCGDGVICSSRGEQCDDDNNADGDGCSSICRNEVSSCEDIDLDGYDTCDPGTFGDDGNSADCNDSNTAIHPGATELCDSVDNNCNSTMNEGFTAEQCPNVCAALGWHWAGNATLLLPALNCCGNDPNEAGPYQITETSCSDGNDNNCNGLTDINDANCGGGCNNTGENDHINAATPGQCNQCTVNGDQEGDQTTDNPTIDWLSPSGIADTCDSDCNTAMATTATRSVYRSAENTLALCADGYDNDCNGLYNCADPGCQTTTACCANECTVSGTRGCVTGTTTVRWECGNFDADPCLERQEISCGTQICNTSNGNCVTPCTDDDNDGYSLEGGGSCCGASGTAACGTGIDCNDSNPYMYPSGTETCDGYDNNCNGNTDEGCDDDGDNYCDIAMSYYNNWAAPPYLPIVATPCANTSSSANRDCDDTNTAVNPGATEVCDGADNNCNSSTDEGFSREDCQATCTAGASGYTWTGLGGLRNCCGNDTAAPYFEANPFASPETGHCSDTRDNDCDGLIDCLDVADCGTDPYCVECTFTFTLPCTFP